MKTEPKKYVGFVGGGQFKQGTYEEVRKWATNMLLNNSKHPEAHIYELVEIGSLPTEVPVTFRPVEDELPFGNGVDVANQQGLIADPEGRN